MRSALRPVDNVGVWKLLLASRRSAAFHQSDTVTRTTNGARSFASTSSQQAVPPKVQLRPYQEESIQSVLNYLTRGEKRLGISLATGSGKTVIFSHLLDRIPAPTEHATQTLILAHRRELVEQAARHCQNLYPEKVVDTEMGNSHASGIADITVASIQSITSGDRLLRFDPDRFKLILVDEAHHIVSASYMRMLEHFKLGEGQQRGPAALVGVSATFSRHDGIKLGTAIDHIVYHKDYVDMIEDQWLSNVLFTTVQTGADLDKVKSSHGDFHIGALSKAVNIRTINALTVRSWFTKAEGRRSTLVFCVDLAHVADLTAEFRREGVDARFVTSETPSKIRAERLEAFKKGECPVLLNCGIFTEGTDIPNVDCVVLARPTQSRNLLVQMLGRGLRLHPGKENCHVIDMVASLETGIVTVPTLFGLDPKELIESADYKEMKSLQERRQEEVEREQQASKSSSKGSSLQVLTGDIVFTDYDDVHDLIDDTAGERHIRQLSPFAWVQIDETKYILSNNDGSFVRIKRSDDADGFDVTYTAKVPGDDRQRILARPRNLAKARSVEEAVRAADTFVAKSFPFPVVGKTAVWRRSPASQGQVDFLNKFRPENDKLEYGSVTKGRAADRITKIKHGARGSFVRSVSKQKRARREADKREKWRTKQQDSRIRVGRVSI